MLSRFKSNLIFLVLLLVHWASAAAADGCQISESGIALNDRVFTKNLVCEATSRTFGNDTRSCANGKISLQDGKINIDVISKDYVQPNKSFLITISAPSPLLNGYGRHGHEAIEMVVKEYYLRNCRHLVYNYVTAAWFNKSKDRRQLWQNHPTDPHVYYYPVGSYRRIADTTRDNLVSSIKKQTLIVLEAAKLE